MNQSYSEQLISKNPHFRNLTNEQIVKILIARTKNLEEPDFKMAHADLVAITSLDHYVCKKILNNEKIQTNSMLDTYLKQIGIELQKQPLLIYSLPICNINSQILSKYIPNYNDIYQKCSEYMKNIKEIKSKFLNNKANLNEINYMIKFLNYFISYNNVEQNNDFFKEVVKFLLKRNQLGLHSASFCFKYFGYKKCKEEELKDIPILFGHFDNPNNIGGSINSTITLSKEKMVNTSFLNNTFEEFKLRQNGSMEGFQLLQTIYHELRHAVQDRDKYANQETDLSYSISSCDIIHQLDGTEYHRNYTTYDIESDANKHGYRQLLQTIRYFAPEYNLQANIVDQLVYKYSLKYAFDYKTDEHNHFAITGQFLVQQLDNYFKLHPETLQTKYSQFTKFYQPDGKPISLTKLLSEKHSRNYENFLLNQIVGRTFQREKINKEEVARFSLDQKREVIRNINNIIYAIYSKLSFCKDRLTFNNHFNINNFGNVDENQLMIVNCNMYYKVAKGYATLANYLIQNYPELQSICSHSIPSINRNIELIIKDAEAINSTITTDKKIEIVDITLIEENNGKGQR